MFFDGGGCQREWREREGREGAPRRGSGCDMKYSDGGGKIQLAPFFSNRAGLLQGWAGEQEMVVIWEEKVSESVIARRQGEEMRNTGANGGNGGEVAQSEQAGKIKRNKICLGNSLQKEASVEMSREMGVGGVGWGVKKGGGEEVAGIKGGRIPFDCERLRPKLVS